ncbi:MAG: hypothetical protein M3P96_10985 [Actinomycetota bacterium]|nr:hypothetical protein [Actinomycetota bacterium]
MSVLRLEVLAVAALVSAPALWAALVGHTLPLDIALLRFLVAVPVCAVGYALLRALFRGYADEPPPRRRRMDHDGHEALEGER